MNGGTQLALAVAARLSELVLLSATLLSLSTLLRRWRSRVLYPPGPGGPPFLGVARQRPTSEPWKAYAQWGRQYGNKGLISFEMLGRRIVVINSRSVADDLLVHRGTIYSDRPFPTMSGRLMQREKSIFLISQNERFKTYRRLMQQNFNPRAVQAYWPIHEHATHVFLNDLLKSPENLRTHIRRHAAAVIMKIAYGYTVQPENDHFVALAEKSIAVASLAGVPGRWLVDTFPTLRFIPSWFPGAGFKRRAKEWGAQLRALALEPHNYVKREMAAGRAVPSFTSTHLMGPEGSLVDAEEEDIVLWTAGGLYFGGSDTTVSAMITFFYTMVCHPEIQRRAQAEIDAAIGPDRLPALADRSVLPFVGCIIKEVLRWHPAVPLALPHATSAHDAYRGYAVPKGTFVIANLWAMLHDEAVYPNPMAFDPSRFGAKGEGGSGKATPQPDPRDIVFGRGRRVCPGQHIAEASLFIQIASVLAAFDVRPVVDESGQEVLPELAFTTGVVSSIKPFDCRITPRSGRGRTLIEQSLTLHDDP